MAKRAQRYVVALDCQPKGAACDLSPFPRTYKVRLGPGGRILKQQQEVPFSYRLIGISSLATLFEVLDYRIERQIGLGRPLFEGL